MALALQLVCLWVVIVAVTPPTLSAISHYSRLQQNDFNPYGPRLMKQEDPHPFGIVRNSALDGYLTG